MFGTSDLGNGIGLRPSRPGDTDFERMLHDANRWDLWLADVDADFIRGVAEMQQRAQVEGYGTQFPEALYFVIEKTGTACGRLVLDFSAGHVHVVDLAMIPEAQGKGIGERVLKAVQSVAAGMGTPVVLMAQVVNAPALRTYEKLGFRAVHRPNPAFVRLAWTPAPDA
jgi:ribosomal protein S18 acetylase RimI-like enzyme